MHEETDWHNVSDDAEAFYLQVYGEGEYRYPGADLGILVTRDRMQTDSRELLARGVEVGRGDRRAVPRRPARGPGGHPGGAAVRQVVLTSEGFVLSLCGEDTREQSSVAQRSLDMGTDDKARHKAEELKGKAKETAGSATGDEDLREEGRADQASSDLKQAGDKVKDAFKR